MKPPLHQALEIMRQLHQCGDTAAIQRIAEYAQELVMPSMWASVALHPAEGELIVYGKVSRCSLYLENALAVDLIGSKGERLGTVRYPSNSVRGFAAQEKSVCVAMAAASAPWWHRHTLGGLERG